MRRLWISFISKTIWTLERIFFYPKLAKFYKTLPPERNGGSDERFSNSRIVILDVGANKGQSTEFFLETFKENANLLEIHAFEPNEQPLNILRNKFGMLSSVSIHNIGLSDSAGFRKFFLSPLNETSSFEKPNIESNYGKLKSRILVTKPSKASTEIDVPVTTLDSYVTESGISEIFILKIDVEGHELSVLRGSVANLTDGKIHLIQIERHVDDLHPDQSEEIEKLLQGNGYLRIKSIKHPFGSFYEDIYAKSLAIYPAI